MGILKDGTGARLSDRGAARPPCRPPTVIDDAILSWTWAYWDRLRADRPMPLPAAIDPLDIRPDVLPQMMLTDVLEGARRFRFRLFGTGLADAAGFDQTGLHLDELRVTEDYRAYLIGLFNDVCGQALPLFTVSDFLRDERYTMATKRLMLPLSDDGAAVDRVLTVQTFFDPTHMLDHRKPGERLDFSRFAEKTRCFIQ